MIEWPSSSLFVLSSQTKQQVKVRVQVWYGWNYTNQYTIVCVRVCTCAVGIVVVVEVVIVCGSDISINKFYISFLILSNFPYLLSVFFFFFFFCTIDFMSSLPQRSFSIMFIKLFFRCCSHCWVLLPFPHQPWCQHLLLSWSSHLGRHWVLFLFCLQQSCFGGHPNEVGHRHVDGHGNEACPWPVIRQPSCFFWPTWPPRRSLQCVPVHKVVLLLLLLQTSSRRMLQCMIHRVVLLLLQPPSVIMVMLRGKE